jgi:hypothetical protein
LFAASLIRVARQVARLRRGDPSPQQGGGPLT